VRGRPGTYSPALDLLARVTAAGAAGGFALREVARDDRPAMEVALDLLADLGAVEPAAGAGRTTHRLTAAGRAMAAAGRLWDARSDARA